jgi:hypothetical protein
MRKKLKLIGQKFNKLTVVSFAYMKNHQSYWYCKCNCGNQHIVVARHLTSGGIKSCGCSHNIHKLSKTRFYAIWHGMKQRCLNSNRKVYKYYGAKGIKVCDRWLEFKNFKDDMNFLIVNGLR